MSDLNHIKGGHLNPIKEGHFILDQPLLRLPHELARKNFKSAQLAVERLREPSLATIHAAANSSISGGSAAQTLATLDIMITRIQGLKRKIESLAGEEAVLHRQSKKRIQHLGDLYKVPSFIGKQYDEWSRIRLHRLIADYLLRSGYGGTARTLAEEKNIEELVDLNVFVQCHRIQESLLAGKTQECLAWCADNKQALKKINSELEFELRLQQYVELVRMGHSGYPSNFNEARIHSVKFLTPHSENKYEKQGVIKHAAARIFQAAGLFAFPPHTMTEPYRSLYAHARWSYLSRLFVSTHHNLLSLPTRPLLHIALSAGLSSLKTPSCHSSFASSSSNSKSSTTSVCPICSTELNDLARNVPYAHHTTSYVETDPVVLPNGRIYGRERLLRMNSKVGVPDGQVKDPITGEIFAESKVRKVYIS
ncbi:MAG: GID complex subunit containing RING finger motif [Trizodia sp. TS-e1964]|nr:MAG: GID complex subunit containing RING finger motif [Trizodia sp. TS-e1964]